MTNPTTPKAKQNRRESALLGKNGRFAMTRRLTFAVCRAERSAQREVDVGQQRVVRMPFPHIV